MRATLDQLASLPVAERLAVVRRYLRRTLRFEEVPPVRLLARIPPRLGDVLCVLSLHEAASDHRLAAWTASAERIESRTLAAITVFELDGMGDVLRRARQEASAPAPSVGPSAWFDPRRGGRELWLPRRSVRPGTGAARRTTARRPGTVSP